jgi:hypothetical protein
MKYKLIIAMMSITASIALTGAQFVISAKISSKIFWQVHVPLTLVKPTSVHVENGVTIIKWIPEAQLAAACGGLIFGLLLYSYLFHMMIKKVWPPTVK